MGGGGVAFQARGVAVEEDGDLAAGGGEAAGGDEAVAAVVAGAGDDEDGAVGGEGGGGFGDGAAGGFHQRHAGDAAGDGEAVGPAHLGGGEELVHVSAQRPASAWRMRRNSAMFSRSTMPARRPARVMQTRRVSGLRTVARRSARGVVIVGGAGGGHRLLDAGAGAEVVQAAQERGLGEDAGDPLAVEHGEVLLGAGEGEVDGARERVAGRQACGSS